MALVVPFTFRVVGKESARLPQRMCDHGCDYLIQVVGPDDDVQFEMCPLWAEQFAGELLNAIELSHLSN
ncbi:hypothetical protein URH17368_2174 [Alicyclobacillus hesperidum URH17-3-68]|uniref:hypothetical protein n=1 Tax=Alicyclobacillus hesperidum TaxID=89784 RepID=UPI000281C1EA|nr:hypothetical protein URH17368_2174 [Alicyclobacillus hesperidum URH17-3-68]KRW91488.1 hypothetical protein SD51_09130 [Alicyclobacillus tengchongensis]